VRQIRFTAGILLLVSLCSCISHHISIPEEDLEVTLHRELLIDETVGNNRLLVCSFGSPPLLLKHRCIMGSGLDILIINRNAEKTVFTYSQGEIEGDLIIDYSDAESGVFRFTDFTCDPREDDEVPFLLETATVRKDGTVELRQEILLKPEDGDIQRIRQLRDAALRDAERESNEWESILGHLRNIGMRDPDNVLEAFKSFCGKAVCDGAFSEILGNCVSEVELAKRLLNERKE
jgi:hypothetical protein